MIHAHGQSIDVAFGNVFRRRRRGVPVLEPPREHLRTHRALTIGLSGVLCLLLAFHFGRMVKSAGVNVWAEDREDAEIDDGDPEVGFFSPWRWWPVLLGAASSLVVLGLAISAWIVLIAVRFLRISVIGWVYEYSRGSFAR